MVLSFSCGGGKHTRAWMPAWHCLKRCMTGSFWLAVCLCLATIPAVVMLFGGLPCLRGKSRRPMTLSSRAHWLDLPAGLLGVTRASPGLQILYFTTMLAGYHLYAAHVFSLLPMPGAPLWHQWTGAALLGACLLAFGIASSSNPGVITAENLKAHSCLYARHEGTCGFECSICRWQQPARSRHCHICKRCVARFDHHCPWINGCVGLLNLRWLLLFLLAQSSLCAYAAALACVVLKGEMARQGVWHAHVMDHRSGHLVAVRHRPRLILSWLLQQTGPAVLLTACLAFACTIVAVFLCYHICLIAHGTTTYEIYLRQRSQAGAEQQGRAPRLQTGGSAWQWLISGWPVMPGLVSNPVCTYTGLRSNLMEVLFPVAFMKSRLNESKSGDAQLED